MDWKDKLNMLRSEIGVADDISEETNEFVPQKKQQIQPLRIELDKRKGKPATLITGFEGTDSELKELTKTLKAACASGGSYRNGEILIQGDFRVKITDIIQKMGYKVKKINFK